MRKVGEKFELSEELYQGDVVNEVGSYLVISSPLRGLLIQGVQLVNIFDLAISRACIIPLDEEMQEQIEDFPFEYEEILYSVSYSGYAWYFKDRTEAFIMLDVLLSVKELALKEKGER